MALFDSLDASQRAFVEAPEGDNIRLLAPAGCGKTLCLLHRCKHLKGLAASRRTRFLIVMFTVAAQQELLKRLNENSEFSDLRDLVKITTLNAWGWDRVKKMDSVCNANLINKDRDKFSLAKNDLKPVWKKYEKIKQVIKNRKKNKFPKELINLIDDFKSLGFDHLDHSDFNKFSSHVDRICRHNIGRELFYKDLSILKDYEIIDGNAYPENILTDLEKTEIYDSFFQFWKDSCKHSLDIDK